MLNPNVESISKGRSTGPRTDEGKARSSRNALKHGLFSKVDLIEGESQEQFDALFDGLKEDHKPRTATEECLVHRLASIQWKLIRMDRHEAIAAKKAEETGEVDHKAMANFSLYHQRMNRDFQSLLKTLHAEQTPRLIDHGQEWRAAVLLQDFAQRTNSDWKPSDSGFDFSPELLDKQLAFNKLWARFGKNIRIFPTTKYQDERYARFAL